MNTIIQKYIFLIIGLTVTIAGVHYLALTPLQHDLGKVAQETIATHAKLIDYQVTMNTINDYLRRKSELQSQKDDLTARLYNKAEILALVNHLKSSAKQQDLRVKEISPSISELLALNALPPEDGSPRYLDIAMRYTGSIHNAGKFLASLETEPMFVELLSFNIIARESGLVPAEFRVRFSSIVGGTTDSQAGAQQ